MGRCQGFRLRRAMLRCTHFVSSYCALRPAQRLSAFLQFWTAKGGAILFEHRARTLRSQETVLCNSVQCRNDRKPLPSHKQERWKRPLHCNFDRLIELNWCNFVAFLWSEIPRQLLCLDEHRIRSSATPGFEWHNLASEPSALRVELMVDGNTPFQLRVAFACSYRPP